MVFRSAWFCAGLDGRTKLADLFRDPISSSISRHRGRITVEPTPPCPNCGALVDLTPRNAVTPVIYRNVMCRNCGVICILEGPERNVNDGSVSTADEACVASVR